MNGEAVHGLVHTEVVELLLKVNENLCLSLTAVIQLLIIFVSLFSDVMQLRFYCSVYHTHIIVWF